MSGVFREVLEEPELNRFKSVDPSEPPEILVLVFSQLSYIGDGGFIFTAPSLAPTA